MGPRDKIESTDTFVSNGEMRERHSKKTLMRTIKNIFLVSIPSLLFLFVVLEVFFRFAIPAAEKPIAYFDEHDMLLRSHESRRTTGLYTLGRSAQIRSRWRTNNYGWNSSID